MSVPNSVTLAFLGDAFFELSVRRRLVAGSGISAADRLHLAAVHYVNASSQAAAMRGLIGRNVLSAEELEIVRRARNHKPKSMPKNADPVDYKLATSFEALLGYHYCEGRGDIAEALSELAMRIIDGK